MSLSLTEVAHSKNSNYINITIIFEDTNPQSVTKQEQDKCRMCRQKPAWFHLSTMLSELLASTSLLSLFNTIQYMYTFLFLVNDYDISSWYFENDKVLHFTAADETVVS